MAVLPVPYTVEIQSIGYHEDDKRETVVHYRHGSAGAPPDTGDLQALANAWVGNVLVRLIPCVAVNTVFDHVRAIDISVLNGAQNVDSDPLTPTTGNSAGEALPGFANVCLTKMVNVHARGTMGRLFVEDITEPNQNDDVIGQALIQLLLELALSMLLHLPDAHGQSYAPVVASKKHGTFYTMTGVQFDNIMDTLRTRGKLKRRHKRRRAPA